MQALENPKVSVNIVVYNGARYIRHCLSALKKQDYGYFEVNILDNKSTDETAMIIKREFPEFRLIKNNVNLGPWVGWELLYKQTEGKYIIFLSVDVILVEDFITRAVETLESDLKIGGVQAKIYAWNFTADGTPLLTNILDTTGFQIFRTRRIINRGHGEIDRGQYDRSPNKGRSEIFATEGAVPVFRRSAIDDTLLEEHIIDPEYYWYGEDLDFAWRMRNYGWKHVYDPSVVAYHNRSTTKKAAKHWYDHFSMISQRSQLPIEKRRLEWLNVRFTIIKNDNIISLVKDLPFILARELAVFIYGVLIEPMRLTVIIRFFKLLPVMIRRRKIVQKKANARK